MYMHTHSDASARVVTDKLSIHTHTQSNYSNPRCACTPRVINTPIHAYFHSSAIEKAMIIIIFQSWTGKSHTNGVLR